MYIDLCIYMHRYMFVYIYLYIYAHMYVCVCVCIYKLGGESGRSVCKGSGPIPVYLRINENELN